MSDGISCCGAGAQVINTETRVESSGVANTDAGVIDPTTLTAAIDGVLNVVQQTVEQAMDNISNAMMFIFDMLSGADLTEDELAELNQIKSDFEDACNENPPDTEVLSQTLSVAFSFISEKGSDMIVDPEFSAAVSSAESSALALVEGVSSGNQPIMEIQQEQLEQNVNQLLIMLNSNKENQSQELVASYESDAVIDTAPPAMDDGYLFD
jgi:hypothetical protein